MPWHIEPAPATGHGEWNPPPQVKETHVPALDKHRENMSGLGQHLLKVCFEIKQSRGQQTFL